MTADASTTAAVPAGVADWFEALEPLPLAEAARDPARTAIFSADMVNGFCHAGALASERVGALAPVVAGVFERAHAAGVGDFVLLQDTHDPDAAEFAAFPPHCVRGTEESETIPELAKLPFAETFAVVEKNTLHPGYGTGLEEWLQAHPGLRTAIVVGNCTDLCVYQAAMHLRMRANALGLAGFEVIVPADAVDTFDAPGHDGDFHHRVFLSHLALNGVRVVATLS